MIKVSIIVPVYNVEKYLEKCLDSLLNQTLKDIEIICINDGSSDNSLLILENYSRKDNRIKIIDKENEGQAIARNIGLKMATGDYIGFVDSDDWVDLDYFEKLYDTAEKYDCDIACAGFKRCRKNRNSIKKKYTKELVFITANDKVRADNLPNDNYVWNKLYKRDAWVNNNFEFQKGRYFEDIALVIKLLHKMGKMVTVPKIYYNYRVNPNSTVTNQSIKHKVDYDWAAQERLKYAEDNNIWINTEKILQKKEYIKILGLTMMKIYYYENLIKYNLFGFLPVGKKVTM